MSVEVDKPAVRRAWEGGVGDVRAFAFTPTSRATDATLVRVQRSLDRTNEAARTSWLDLDNLPTVGRRPVRVGRSVVWEIETQHPDGPLHWLNAFAETLGAAGANGTIGPFAYRNPGRMDTLVDGRRVPGMMAALSWKGRGPFRPSGNPGMPAWRVDPSIVPLLVEITVGFLERTPGHTSAEVGQIVELDSSELPNALQDALTADPVEVPLVWGRRSGIDLNREVTFDLRGHVLFSLSTGPSRLFTAAEEMCADLAGIASTHCEWAALLEGGLAHSFYDGYRHARGARLADYYRSGHNEDTDFLPDAFAWQMVGPAQISKANDLRRWHVERLGDLTLIRKRTLADWVALDDNDPTKLKVDLDQLAQARHDFGAMIRTPRR